MVANKKLLVLPGDGIGPEVMEQVLRVVDWFGDNRAVGFDVKQDLVGGAAYDAHGTPLRTTLWRQRWRPMRLCLGLLVGLNMTMRQETSGPRRVY